MMVPEYVTLLIVRERMQETMRQAELWRALRAARSACRPFRVRLGLALLRLGRAPLDRRSPPPGTSIELGEGFS